VLSVVPSEIATVQTFFCICFDW